MPEKQTENIMTLKELFECDDLNPRHEALDLLTSYYCTMRFLEFFQSAIFDPRQQNRSIKDVYVEFLYSLGLINTDDDLPEMLTGKRGGRNEGQARRNIKYPMGLGSLAAYMSINLGVAKEIVGDKLPKKNSKEIMAAWHLDEFEIIKDEAQESPSVNRIITRLRNAISHHNFKLRIPSDNIDGSDIRDLVEVSFYDTDGKPNNDFYAKSKFRAIEKLIEKMHRAEYFFHSCPYFDGDASNFSELVSYVEKCFSHFSRPYSSRGLKFIGLKRLNPSEEFEVIASTGVFEISRSDFLKFEVNFSLDGVACSGLYIDIPFVDKNRHGRIMIEGDSYELGEFPIEWMLNNQISPICRLDNKIKAMIDVLIQQVRVA